MRRLDEILLHYQRASDPGKSLLLRQLGSISLQFDHSRIRTFLDTEASSGESWNRYLANLGQHTIGPESFARDFGLRETKSGCTSTYYLDQNERPPAPIPVDQTRRLNALTSVLAGPIDGLFGLARPGSPWMSSALSCLGVFSSEQLINRLVDLCREPEVGAHALLALGISASRRARRAATRALKAMQEPDGPSIAVLQYLPYDQHPEWLSGTSKGDECDLGLAIAALGHGGDAGRELVRRLLSSSNPWIRAHALHSLALIGGEPALAIDAYNRETAPLLKILCVQALAASPCTESREALRSFLSDAPAAIQAEIVEVLTLVDKSDDLLPPALADVFLNSSNIQLRGAAAVMLFKQDPERVSASIAEVLSSEDPTIRREGAYCLGMLRHPSSLRKLAKLLGRDPAEDVRLAAITSLLYFPGTVARDALVNAVSAGPDAVSCAALSALADLPGIDPNEVFEALRGVAGSGTAEFQRAKLELFGRLAAMTNSDPVVNEIDQVVRRLDPANLSAALDAFIVSGRPPPEDLLASLEKLNSPEVAARVLFWRFLSGDLETAPQLGELLAGTGTAPALLMMRRVMSLLPFLGVSRRLDRLDAALGAHSAQPTAERATGRYSVPKQISPPPVISPVEPVVDAGPGPFSRPPPGNGAPEAFLVSGQAGPGTPTEPLRWTGRHRLYALESLRPEGPAGSHTAFVLFAIFVSGLLIYHSLPYALTAPAAARVEAAPAPQPPLEGLTVIRERRSSNDLHPGKGKLLPCGQPFRAGTLLTLSTPFPVVTVMMRPGAGQLISVVHQPPPSSGYRIEMDLSEGEYRIESRSGNSCGIFHLSWGTVTCYSAHLDLSVKPDSARMELGTGVVLLEFASGATKWLQGPEVWAGP